MPTKKISDLTTITPLATDLVALDRPTVGAGAPITGKATLGDAVAAITPTVVVTGTFNVPSPGEFVTTASVALAGGEGFSFTADSVGSDTYFFVSGAVGSKDGSAPGVAVFGGDLHISGNLTVDGTSPGGGGGDTFFFSNEENVIETTGSMRITGSLTLGNSSFAIGNVSHAEGLATAASSSYSHSEGRATIAYGFGAHAEGNITRAGAQAYSISSIDNADGIFTLDSIHGDVTSQIFTGLFFTTDLNTGYGYIKANASFDGTNTYVTASDSLRIGGFYGSYLWNRNDTADNYSYVLGSGSHSEGMITYAVGEQSHAEGSGSWAIGAFSHAEGESNITLGRASKAVGQSSIAIGSYSFAAGGFSRTYGDWAIAGGGATEASGSFSTTFGAYTISSGSGQTVIGKFNQRGNDFSLFVIGDGDGSDDANRSDILRVNSGSVIGQGRVEVTGSMVATLGLSGSLTTLTDGTPYLIAGSNITLSTGSSGAVTIAGTGGGGLATGKQHIASYATPASTASQAVGQFSWVPTDFTSLSSVVLRAVLATNGTVNLTGSLQVYNITSGSFLDLVSAPAVNKHLAFTGSAPTLFSSANLLAAGTNFDNSSTSVYEVRVSGSSANTIVVGGVELVFS